MYARFAKEGIVPSWLPFVVAIRAGITDSIRLKELTRNDEDKMDFFAVGDTMLGNVITTSILSRVGYGLSKAALPQVVHRNQKAARTLSFINTGICLARAIPVIIRKRK